MKKLTTMIVSIVCLVVLLAGCTSAPAGAEETKTEDTTQQQEIESTTTPETTETSVPTESSETTQSSESEETKESSNEPVDVGIPDYEISGWSIRGDGQNAYLAHRTGIDPEKDVEEAYVFDSGSGIEADQCTIVDKSEDESLFLLHQHRNFYTLNLNTNELKCIVECYLDYYYDNGDAKLFYLDLEYNEYFFDWQNSDTSVATGNMHPAYIRGEFYPIENEDFSDIFTAIQDAVKYGADPKQIKNVEVMENGDIYDLNGQYIGNIHLPAPYELTPNVQFDERGMEIFMDATTVKYCRYGQVIQEFNLPYGVWKVIQSEITYNVDPDEFFSRDFKLGELESAIQETQILVYNIDDKSVWKIDSNGANLVCKDVVDYQEYDGVLYWMDSRFKPYVLNWLDSNESVQVDSEVVAVAHYSDARVGFIVRSDDPRANGTEDGVSIFRP